MRNTNDGIQNGGKSYGRVMLIKGYNNRLYLLAHLSKYNKIETELVFPGDTVAYVGNTGNCAGLSEEEKKDGSGTHLHLTVYMTEKAKFISNQPVSKMAQELDRLLYSNSDRTYKTYSCENYKNINPFYYGEKR